MHGRLVIHVDADRAAVRDRPFGTTIAPGYLTPSLDPALLPRAVEIDDVDFGANDGWNCGRLTSPVCVAEVVGRRSRNSDNG